MPSRTLCAASSGGVTCSSAGSGGPGRWGRSFSLSLASKGVEIDCPPSFQTGVLSYGPLDAQGHSRVTLAYDHRLMDGMLVAQALERIEQILHGQLADEMRSLDGTSTKTD